MYLVIWICICMYLSSEQPFYDRCLRTLAFLNYCIIYMCPHSSYDTYAYIYLAHHKVYFPFAFCTVA